MKTYTLILAILLSGCKEKFSEKNGVFIVTSGQMPSFLSERQNLGFYRYNIIGTESALSFVYYTDSIYNLGDTLKLVKQ